MTRVAPGLRLTVDFVVGRLGFDEGGLGEVGDAPTDRRVVDVHEKVVVVDVHGQLEAFDELVVAD